MTGDVFLTALSLDVGVGATAAVAYFLLRGTGAHRLVMPRSQLRAEAARASAEAEELASKLIALASELDAVTGGREEALALLGKAEQLVTDLERDLDAARKENTQLEELNTALQARLANATAIRPLTPVQPLAPPATPRPSSVVVPLDQAPFALSPAEPS